MSDDLDTASKALAQTPAPTAETYEVGYCKPPKATQFKKGQSGNPKGRPKGAKNKLPSTGAKELQNIILSEAYRVVDVNEGGESVSYTMAEAVMRSIAVNAAKGGIRAQELFTHLVTTTEKEQYRERYELLEAFTDYKQKWYAELADRARTGRKGPEPLPHPDDIVINYRTGDLKIKGPTTKEEKHLYDLSREHKSLFIEEVASLEGELEQETDPETRKEIKKELKRCKKVLEMMRTLVPDEPTLRQETI